MAPKTPTSREPVDEQQLKFGNEIHSPMTPRWEIAAVLDVHPQTQTYKVVTGAGRIMANVVRLYSTPGELTLLERGAQVVVHYELGFPAIAALIKGAPLVPTQEVAPIRVTEVEGIGGEDPVYAQDTVGTGRALNEPTDMIGGDWHRMSRDGNMMSVMAGGVNQMKSGPMSQIRTHSIEQLVEIISEKFRHVTGMGDLKIDSSDGKTSLVWRAGSDQDNESGAGRSNWTIRLDVGAEGDLFNFEVTTPQGQSLARIHMSSEGTLELSGVGGVNIMSGSGGLVDEIVDSSKETVITGDHKIEVGGAVTETFGTQSTIVSGAQSTIIGATRATNITEDDNQQVSGSQRVRIYQDAIMDILQGNRSEVLGNPAFGGVPGVIRDYQLINYAGSLLFGIQPTAPTGRFAVISQLPGSVMLGASGAIVFNPATGLHSISPVAPYGAVLFEPLAALLANMLFWMDGHGHLTGVGPTTPASVGPLGPVTPLIQPQIQTLRSLRVALGG